MFELFYKKNKHIDLFNTLEKSKYGNFSHLQSYIPIYSKFFKLNDTNWNHINLNHKNHIMNVIQSEDDNNYTIKLENNQTIKSFFKLSPLIDPIKFMTGKYKKKPIDLLYSLPSVSSNDNVKKSLDKLYDVNNAAYIDSFFSFLSSMLLHQHNFIHGIDFYGSFLSIKKNYKINIADEFEYVHNSTYFIENNEKLFKLNNNAMNDYINIDTRNYKKRIIINHTNTPLSVDSYDNTIFDSVFESSTNTDTNTDTNNGVHTDISNELIFEFNITKKSNSNSDSTCSSRNSLTSIDSNNSDDSDNSDNSDDSDDSDNSDDSDESCSTIDSLNSMDYIEADINKYPVQIICLEKLHNTLDNYIINNEINIPEWKSILFQIIMTLITYQKAFNFTHNDLHTNNIMYNETNRKFIYYHYQNTYYKVPTYGKIYKIIDYGRAVYKYKQSTMYSDSYHPKGDAATQYNCEPYFNANKPRITPNQSFDLCRLGCSLFDYFVEDIKSLQNITNPIAKKIIEWCTDDDGLNILYKSNNKERYPGFKLYKMIARNVHNHTPIAQLDSDLFDCLKTIKKHIKRKVKVLDINKIPIYWK